MIETEISLSPHFLFPLSLSPFQKNFLFPFSLYSSSQSGLPLYLFPPHFSPLLSIIHSFYSPSFIPLSPLSVALSFCPFEPLLLETALLFPIYLSIYLSKVYIYLSSLVFSSLQFIWILHMFHCIYFNRVSYSLLIHPCPSCFYLPATVVNMFFHHMCCGL